MERKLKRRDLWVLIFVPPPFIFLFNYCLLGATYLHTPAIFREASLLMGISVLVQWRLHIYADFFIRRRFHTFEKLWQRLAISLAIHAGIMTCCMTTFTTIAHVNGLWGYRFAWPGYLGLLAAGLGMNLSSIGFHEGVHMFYSWRDNWLEAEKIKKNNLKRQLTGLKSQVTPHFLFNSMNTLSSLIETDAPHAEVFLDEMTKVYRYLLQVDKADFVTLEQELTFIRSWFFVISTRYAGGVSLELNIAPEARQQHLPVLSLMTSIENIMASNVADKKDPLHIIVQAGGDKKLYVGHAERIKKYKPGAGNDTDGFHQLLEKYRLMGLPDITHQYNEGWRWTILPLVSPQTVG